MTSLSFLVLRVSYPFFIDIVTKLSKKASFVETNNCDIRGD